MKTMKQAVGVFCLLLGACASGPATVRFSAGVTRSTVQAEDDEGTRQGERGAAPFARVEVSQPSPDFRGVEVGLYVEGGAVDYVSTDESDLQQHHASVGAVIRGYMTEGRLRPYAEVRGGYRHSWFESFGDERGGPGYELGAALGLQLELGGGAALHAAVDYTGARSDFGGIEFDEHGPALMLGGSFRF